MSESAAARLCSARLVSLGGAPDAGALAEVIWLAWTLRGTVTDETLRVGVRGPTLPALAVTPDVDDTAADRSAKRSPVPAATGDTGRSWNLFQPRIATDTEPFLTASFVAVPAGEALPQRRLLERALKPFKRRLVSHRRQVLDATATAEASAEARAISPVFRPAPERWFEVALLVEKGGSMQLWEQTIADLQHLMAGHGAFRRVAIWHHTVQAGVLKLSTAKGGAAPPRIVADPQGRRLCLFLTHGTSPEWRRVPLVDFVRRLGRAGPVAIVQMMPRRAWSHTLLGDALDEVRTNAPGVPNARLRRRNPFSDAFEREPKASTVPLLTLEPDAVRAWAGFMMSARVATHMAVRLEATDEVLNDVAPEAARAEPSSLRQQVTAFRAIATPQAYQLMRLLAGLPLTLPIIRLMQRGMSGERAQAHLAEVLLSGLIRRVTPPDSGLPADSVEYEFVNGVREELLGSLASHEIERVEDVLRPIREGARRFVEAHVGKAIRTTTALFRDPDGAERMLASAQSFLTVLKEIDALRHVPADISGPSESAPVPASLMPPSSELPPPTEILEFLPQLEVEALVRARACELLARDPGRLRCLLLLSSKMQQTWLVASDDALAFVLDDVDTRRASNLVLRFDAWLDALPVTLTMGKYGESPGASVALGPADKSPWFYSTSLFASPERLRSAIHNLMPRESAQTLRNLRDLALQYEKTRKDNSPGTRRTESMNATVDRMRGQSRLGELDLGLLTRSGSEGNRLVAVIALQTRFDFRYLDWLAQEIRTEQAFVAFHASIALRQAMSTLSPAQRHSIGLVAAAVRKDLSSFGLRDRGVNAVLEAIELEVVVERKVPASGYRVFVSARADQHEERRRLVDALNRLGHSIIQVPFVDSPGLAEIVECNVFVSLVGLRYSVWMEHEYHEAVRLRKPTLILMQENNEGSIKDLGETENTDRVRFNRLLLGRQVVTRYQSVDDLARLLPSVLSNLSDIVGTRSAPNDQSPDPVPPVRANVLVAGSGRSEVELSEKLLQTCVMIGTELARRGYSLFTGGGPGVDEITSRSFAQELARLDLPLASRLTQFVDEIDTLAFDSGRVTSSKTGGQTTYAVRLKMPTFVILIGGEGGVRALANAADKVRWVVLPLADTGGNAARVHAELVERAASESGDRASLGLPELDRLAGSAPDVVAELMTLLDQLADSLHSPA